MRDKKPRVYSINVLSVNVFKKYCDGKYISNNSSVFIKFSPL